MDDRPARRWKTLGCTMDRMEPSEMGMSVLAIAQTRGLWCSPDHQKGDGREPP